MTFLRREPLYPDLAKGADALVLSVLLYRWMRVWIGIQRGFILLLRQISALRRFDPFHPYLKVELKYTKNNMSDVSWKSI